MNKLCRIDPVLKIKQKDERKKKQHFGQNSILDVEYMKEIRKKKKKKKKASKLEGL